MTDLDPFDALRRDPESPEALTQLARIKVEQGNNVAEASEHIDRALKVDPRFGPALALRAEIYATHGEALYTEFAKHKPAIEAWLKGEDENEDDDSQDSDCQRVGLLDRQLCSCRGSGGRCRQHDFCHCKNIHWYR